MTTPRFSPHVGLWDWRRTSYTVKDSRDVSTEGLMFFHVVMNEVCDMACVDFYVVLAEWKMIGGYAIYTLNKLSFVHVHSVLVKCSLVMLPIVYIKEYYQYGYD